MRLLAADVGRTRRAQKRPQDAAMPAGRRRPWRLQALMILPMRSVDILLPRFLRPKIDLTT